VKGILIFMKSYFEGPPPLVVNFEEGRVNVNPDVVDDQAPRSGRRGMHNIIAADTLHRSTDETGIALAESRLITEPQSDPINPDFDSVVLSWMLKYSDGFEATRYTRRTMRAMETARDFVGIRDVSMHADIPGFSGYADAYRWTTGSGMDLMAIINHRDRFVSLANAAGDEHTEPAFRIKPPVLSEIDLPTQLEEFGASVLMLGERAIPGLQPIEAAQTLQAA
jgi:hypothetical protein